jgi:hypothetical protein
LTERTFDKNPSRYSDVTFTEGEIPNPLDKSITGGRKA